MTVFDPVNARWSAAVPLPPRNGSAVVALENGGLLRLGGEPLGLSTQESGARIERFDPDTGWTSAGMLSPPRTEASATALAGGDVLIVGGRAFDADYPRGAEARVERWRPPSHVESRAPLHTARWAHAAVRLPQGEVLVLGGRTSPTDGRATPPLASTERYAPEHDVWTVDTPLPAPMANPSAVALPSGEVVAADEAGLFLRDGRAQWAVLSEAPYGNARLVALDACSVLVTTDLAFEVWDIDTPSRIERSHPIVAHPDASLTVLSDDAVLVLGETSELWTTRTPATTPGFSWSLPEPLAFFRPDDDLLALEPVGGDRWIVVESSLRTHASLRSSRWSIQASFEHAYAPRSAAAVVSFGEAVLVVGGLRRSVQPPERERASLEEALAPSGIFDPATGWENLPEPRRPRWGATATRLQSDALLIGGVDARGRVRLIERFDTTRRTWAPAGMLRAGRVGHTATFVPSPRRDAVLIVGGCAMEGTAAPPSDLAELWLAAPRPHTIAAGRLTEGRCGHVAVPLEDGRVLVAGGFANGSWSPSTGGPTGVERHSGTELWDPTTRTWQTVAPMHAPRALAAAARLADGRVLIVGGESPDPRTLPTAEIYDPHRNVWDVVGTLPIHTEGALLRVLDETHLLLAADQVLLELVVHPQRAPTHHRTPPT